MNSGIISGITNSEKLERKMHLIAKVLKTSTAGAIVDIGVETPALLHVSQIILPQNTTIKKVSDILQEGQELAVWIRNIRKDRIEVTMKEPYALEWREINKDMVVKGKVVQIERFGAFVDIGAEKPGLVHISELTQGYVKNPSDVVNVGNEVEVKIIDMNRRKKQIKLSMKALQPGSDELDGVTVTPARPAKKHRQKKEKEEKPKLEETKDEEPTAMEFAIRAAMERADDERPQNSRSNKDNSEYEEQEEILQRTLQQRR